jgi:hypothetical protein
MTGSRDGRAVRTTSRSEPVVQGDAEAAKVLRRLRELQPLRVPIRSTREWDRVRRIAYL